MQTGTLSSNRGTNFRIWAVLVALMALLVLAGCQVPAAPAAPEAPAESAEAAPTEAAEEEAEPTAEPEEEVAAESTATPAAEEEAEATATPAAEEEAEPTSTPVAEEEGATAEMVGDPLAGEYIFNSTMGCGCHFNRDLGTLAGGNRFEGPFGAVHAINLTPDMETGLGAWTVEEFGNAIRFGVTPFGGVAPAMPRWSRMADEDVANLYAYLMTLEPVSNEIPAREVTVDLPNELPEQMPPATAPTEGIERGAYMASLVRCGNCHTPRNEDGSFNNALFLAGAPFRDTTAPNITPHETTGIGAWTDEELAEFLRTGAYGEGLDSHPGMKSVADRATGKMTDEDRMAIVAFLRSLEPIENVVTPQQ
ncbi:MAG: hypothetical protein R2873_24830 [Caldilineaceae bacterium]|nr:cytochrome c [Caldilineaceae bacterium]